MMARAPSCTAWLTATVMPLSLKEPLGFMPSNFALYSRFGVVTITVFGLAQAKTARSSAGTEACATVC